MPLYNVRVAVVDLVTAASHHDAIQDLRARIRAAGFEPIDNDHDAFESEDQLAGIDRATADQVLALIEKQLADYLGQAESGRPKLYGHEHENLTEGSWSVAWEGYPPPDWPAYFPRGGKHWDSGVTIPDVSADMPPNVHVEPINNCILGVYPFDGTPYVKDGG